MNTTTAETLDLRTQPAAAYPVPAPAQSMGVSILNEDHMSRMYRFAEIMASGRATVPAHLQGNVGDCMAVALQAQQWGMSPYVVAQKTHLVNGQLGYEAQLVASVINTSTALNGRLHFEWFGEWHKIVGKFKWLESKTKKDSHGNPSKYAVPAWDANKDEEGLGVRVWGTLRGESEPRVLELLMLQARTRNSTLWAEDPKQQIAYLAEKRWARLYLPEVLLGVYTPDEFSMPRDMGAADVLAPEIPEALRAAAFAAADGGRATFGPWWKVLPQSDRRLLKDLLDELAERTKKADDSRTVDNAAAPANAPAASAPSAASSAPAPAPAPAPAAATGRARAPAPKAPAPAAAAPTTDNPGFTADYVRQRLEAATDLDALFIAADLINSVEDVSAHTALNAVFDQRKEQFE